MGVEHVLKVRKPRLELVAGDLDRALRRVGRQLQMLLSHLFLGVGHQRIFYGDGLPNW